MTEVDETEQGYTDPAGDYDEGDIFAPKGPPPFNWTNNGVAGRDYRFKVKSRPEAVQGWDTDNKRPATWPDSGNPKMNAVIQVLWREEDGGDGELYSLWATIPSALYKGLQNASRAVRTSIRPEGDLVIKYGGLGQKERGQRSRPHLFPEVTYIPES